MNLSCDQSKLICLCVGVQLFGHLPQIPPHCRSNQPQGQGRQAHHQQARRLKTSAFWRGSHTEQLDKNYTHHKIKCFPSFFFFQCFLFISCSLLSFSFCLDMFFLTTKLDEIGKRPETWNHSAIVSKNMVSVIPAFSKFQASGYYWVIFNTNTTFLVKSI